MAKVTSSSTRSKRKTNKPVSSDKGRAARQKVSQARVSQSGGGTPGSARVTTGMGGSRGSGSSPSVPKAAPSGRAPRAITNGSSPTMRQLRAKAVQKGRMAQGKSTVASRTPGPSAERMSRIRQTAQRMKPLADGPKVRQAQAMGKKAVAQAQARRGARQAMSRMEGTLRTARTLRNVASAAKTLARGGVAAAVMAPRPTAPGTLTAAKQAGLLKMRRKPTSQEAGAMKAQESRLRAKNAQRKGSSFDDAFRDARRAKAKTFTWRGKKYTTKMKGE